MSPAIGLAVVRGRSMEPTLRDGDRLLIRYGGRVRANKLVVVRLPERPVSVKRAERRVDGGWWVARDNPEEGIDSWAVGAVQDEDIVAVVVARVWPLRRRVARSLGPA
jgi:phage repressor protein C with HTH and peptisase S24 domain